MNNNYCLIFTFKYRFCLQISEVGTNTYAIIRARRTLNEECIILNVPIKNGEENYAVGQVISYAKIVQSKFHFIIDK